MRRSWTFLADSLEPVRLSSSAAVASRGRGLALAGTVVLCVLLVVTHCRRTALHASRSHPRSAVLAARHRHVRAERPLSSDNLVSNELTFQWVIPELQRRTSEGRAYLGVGPDQNFTYLASLQPSIAFIVDIRRDNLRLQLMYKALLELSPTRVQFLSRLFSRKFQPRCRPGRRRGAVVERSTPSLDRHKETLKLIRHHLTVQHGFAISEEDYAGVEYVLTAFFYLAGVTERRSRPLSHISGPDGRLRSGRAAAQLSRQRGAVWPPACHGAQNLIIPIVGDFAGPKALRDVGAYLAAHNTVVRTIYTSNVEQCPVSIRHVAGLLRKRRRPAHRRAQHVRAFVLHAVHGPSGIPVSPAA